MLLRFSIPTASAGLRRVASGVRFSTSLNLGSNATAGTLAVRTNASRAGLPVGPLVPWKGYASTDIEVREASPEVGGGRGIFATADLPYDREVLRVPALTYWIGDEDLKGQTREILKWVVGKLATEKDESAHLREYIKRNVLCLSVGGVPPFSSEDDVRRFMSDVPGGAQLLSREVLSTNDVNRLSMRIDFNRFDIVDPQGRKGLALIPEAALFNHSCEPNVELSFSFNELQEYVVSARILKPVKRGEELMIHYMPNSTLPISRFAMAMRNRWSFECGCNICRSRMTSASVFLCIFVVFPLVLPLRSFYIKRLGDNARRAGFA